MFRTILVYGAVAGVLVGVALFAMAVGWQAHSGLPHSVVVGYTIMLVALSAVFAGIKRHRDQDLGGVIGFWRALGLGLGISIVAGVFYIAAWEAALAVTHWDFAADYAHSVIAAQQAKGVTGAALAKLVAQMAEFRTEYANPLYRLSMSFTEIFPVGVLVSLVSAGLLCNSRFLPLRRV